ncbi:MAG: Laminin G domain protein [Lentisphaerae bacterium ADurb.BinA184]|nr:MAG: Laminin G domain protein [Lentisphaerae bacterium ADurb.BinA184]
MTMEKPAGSVRWGRVGWPAGWRRRAACAGSVGVAAVALLLGGWLAGPWAAAEEYALSFAPAAGAAVFLDDLVFHDNAPGADTIATTAGDFQASGLAAGQRVTVMGTALNDRTFTLQAVAQKLLTLAPADALANEGPVKATLHPATRKPHVQVADEAAFDLTGALTVEAWVKLPAYDRAAGEFPPKSEALVTKGEAWGLVRYSNEDRLAFRTTKAGFTHDLPGPAALTPGEWYHVAGVFDGAGKRLFINGVEVASEVLAGPLDSNDYDLLIGNNEEKPTRAFAGVMDTVRVWSAARSAGELHGVMRRRVRGSEAGLVGAWSFDEAGGVTAFDRSVNRHDGTLHDFDPVADRVKGLVFAAPYPGQHALCLNGGDQFVELNRDVLTGHTGSLTAEAWVKLNQLGAAALVSKGSGAWELGVDAAGHVVWTTSGVAAGGSTTLTGATALAVGEWHHVAGVYDSQARVKLVFVDGVINASAYGVIGTLGTNAERVCFGCRPGTPRTQFFDGCLDAVRLWQAARADELVAAARLRNLTGHEPQLVGVWDFDEGNGAIANNGRHIIEAPGSLVTLDFEDLADDGDTVVEYPSPYESGGFRLVAAPAGNGFSVAGALTPGYSGSAAVYNDEADEAVTLTHTGGVPFRLVSITLADRDPRTSAGTPVTFHAASAAGGAWATVSLDGGVAINLETFTFAGFHAVTALSWKQVASFHQFDSIVVQTLGGLPDACLSTDGALNNLRDADRVESEVVFGPPLPAQYALAFDGATDYLAVAHHAALDIGDAFTIEAWVKPEAFTPATGIFRNLVRKGDTGWGLALDDGGALRYWVSDNPAEALSSTGTVVDGEWQHVAVAVDALNNTVAFYINGQPAGSVESNVINNTATPLVIGRKGPTVDGGYFKGVMDEVRVWDHARTAAQIGQFANIQLPAATTDGLIAYWNCNDGLGWEAGDRSVNGLDAALMSPDLTDWTYGPMAPFRTGMYALEFDGVDDYLQLPHDANLNFVNRLTIEAWVCPEAKDSADPDEFMRTIVMKGDNLDDGGTVLTGYGLALDRNGYLRFWTGPTPAELLQSSGQVADGEWHHVAVVVDGTGTFFYIDGQPAGTSAVHVLNNNTEKLYIGRQGTSAGTARGHYKGILDELRIWDDARTPDEIAQMAGRQLFHGVGGLAAYWSFNHYDPENGLVAQADAGAPAGGDPDARLEAVLTKMDVSAWVPSLYRLDWDGPFWEAEPLDPSLNLSPYAGSAGLWVGKVVLTRVNEVATAQPGESGDVTATADAASLTILLHVDRYGQVRLLKDVILMQSPGGTEDTLLPEQETLGSGELPLQLMRQLVLVTDEALIPQFVGIERRAGQLVGKRLGTVAYDFEGSELLLMGGVGEGRSLNGTLRLPRLHNTNPFRHRYHPDHRNVNPDSPDDGFEVTRRLTVMFDLPVAGAGTRGGYGIDRLGGAYREVITGLHKIPLVAEGRIEISRISDVGVLNE